MIKLQRTVTTDRPVSKVFPYLVDFSNATEWDAGTVSCRRISGDGGVGTSYENVSKFAGRETTLEYVTKQVDPEHTFVIRGDNKTVTSTDSMGMTPTSSGGTEVVYTAEFEFRGAARFLEPLLRLPLKKLGDDAQKSLTAALNRL